MWRVVTSERRRGSRSQVQPPSRKELCYFSHFKRHMQRRRVMASSSWELYTKAFAGREAQLADRRFRRPSLPEPHAPGTGATGCASVGRHSFEACPFYLGEVHAPLAIRAVLPDLRAIAVLRNPRE